LKKNYKEAKKLIEGMALDQLRIDKDLWLV